MTRLKIILISVGIFIITLLSWRISSLKSKKHALNAKLALAQTELALKTEVGNAVKHASDTSNDFKGKGSQRVGDADGGTAAGWLRNNANRDKD